jgi:hypothetical protein
MQNLEKLFGRTLDGKVAIKPVLFFDGNFKVTQNFLSQYNYVLLSAFLSFDCKQK